MTITMSGVLSALQRRLIFAEKNPGIDWLNLVENVPQWPAGEVPAGIVHVPGTSYEASAGNEALLAAIADRENSLYDASVSPSMVLVTCGAMHGLGLVFRQLRAQGLCEILVESPIFRGVYDAAVAAGLTVTTMDGAAVEGVANFSARSGQSGLYLNRPANPHGAVLSEEEKQGLVDLAAAGVPVVLDATYDGFNYRENPVHLTADAALPGLYVVNSLSKNYGLPGERIGWILSTPRNVAVLTAQLEWETVCVGRAAQAFAAQVIRSHPAPLRERVRRGRESFAQQVHLLGIDEYRLPEGGTQAWLDLGITHVEDFADGLLRHGLIVTNSSNYYPSTDGFIRFPLGVDDDVIIRGLEAISIAKKEWQHR